MMAHRSMYTILIVDDNPNNLFTLRTLLQAHVDTDVIEAESGIAALEKVLQQKIDLILLDIQMPGLDGFETAKLIRSRKKYQDIPIIFLTAIYKSEEFKEKGLAGGAIDYLTKPIDEPMLINRVKAYLRLLESERATNRQLEEMNQKLHAEIEERKRMERTLAEERNLLRTLIDNLPDFIYVKDRQSRFLIANKAVVAAFDLTTQEELVGKTDFDFHPRELAEKYYADEQRIFASGTPLSNEEQATIDLRTKQTIWQLTTKIPLRDSQGKLAGLVGINRDITARKRDEEELQRLNRELKEASQNKSDFLSSMSHELRTPLNATIGYTSLTLNMLKGKLAPAELENLIKADHSARSLLQLINDVLDFSKIEAGKMDSLIEEIDLADIIEDVVLTAEGLLLNKPVVMKAEIAPELPRVKSDYTKVKQMLHNLVGNAIKFTPAGSVTVRAMPIPPTSPPAPTPPSLPPLLGEGRGEVRGERGGEVGGVRIEVADTGGGIPPDKLGTVFESYEQADRSVKKQFGGTGLGLAITKSFCDMLGIAIGVESEVGKGTTFWLEIPVASSSAERMAQEELAASANGRPRAGEVLFENERNAAQADEDAQYESVLVVDDDDMNLMLFTDVFKLEGHTVYLTSSGQEAIAIAQAQQPDVIIMDLAMPDVDGFEATQMLKQNPATAGITIIACSALATEDVQIKALALGCDGFITKPIQPEILLRKVRDIVAAAKRRRSDLK